MAAVIFPTSIDAIVLIVCLSGWSHLGLLTAIRHVSSIHNKVHLEAPYCQSFNNFRLWIIRWWQWQCHRAGALRRPPRSTQSRSSAASDVYKGQHLCISINFLLDVFFKCIPVAYSLFIPQNNWGDDVSNWATLVDAWLINIAILFLNAISHGLQKAWFRNIVHCEFDGNLFLSSISTLPRDIDITILSVCPFVRLSVQLSVRDMLVLYKNSLTYRHSFFHHTVAQSY